jgi:hypothetical protein
MSGHVNRRFASFQARSSASAAIGRHATAARALVGMLTGVSSSFQPVAQCASRVATLERG